MAQAPQKVRKLVEKFTRHVEACRRGRCGETHVRVEFLDPLLAALGWDVHNQAACAEACKHVIHEDAVKVGGTTKPPGYCFRHPKSPATENGRGWSERENGSWSP